MAKKTKQTSITRFNTTLSLPIEIREIYARLRKSGRLAPVAILTNGMVKEFPEIAAALEQKGGGE